MYILGRLCFESWLRTERLGCPYSAQQRCIKLSFILSKR